MYAWVTILKRETPCAKFELFTNTQNWYWHQELYCVKGQHQTNMAEVLGSVFIGVTYLVLFCFHIEKLVKEILSMLLISVLF